MTTTRSPRRRSTRAERLRQGTQERREQEKQQLREAILEAAGALFLEVGYEGFSLRQVAERIGYSPGTLYLYFKDKDEVLFTVAEEGFRRFGERIRVAAASSDNPRDRLAALARTYVEFGLRNPVYYQLMFIQRCDFLVKREIDREPRIAIFRLFQQAVEDAMAAGVLRQGDSQSTSDALWALMHGVVTLAIRMPMFDEERTHMAVEAALELLVAGLHCCAPPAAEPPR